MTEAAPSEKLTLRELAEKHGQIVKQVDLSDSPYSWQHRHAAHVHGWGTHDYHYQADPILLSDADYLAAIKLADSGSLDKHEPAIGKPPSAGELARRIADQESALRKAREEKASAQKAEGNKLHDPEVTK